MNNKGKIAITEILILLIGIIAIVYSMGMVSGAVVEQQMETLPYEPSPTTTTRLPIDGYWDPNWGDPPDYDPTTEFSGASVEQSSLPNVAPGSVTIDDYYYGEQAVDKYSGTYLAGAGPGGQDAPIIRENIPPPPTPDKGRTSELAALLGIKDFTARGIVSGLQWAAVAYGVVQMVGPMMGLPSEQTNALSWAAAAGFGVGKAAYVWEWKSPGLYGLGAAVIVYALMYKEVKYKVVKFSCNAWDANTGGNDCEKCNNQILPCSEYQCKSLGQACQLENQGTENELCVAVELDDANPPTIEPWELVLTDGYEYTPDDVINPPDRGVKIVNLDTTIEGGCAKAYTALKFGIVLNEPARCKIDSIRKDNFEEMDIELSSGLKLYNHSIELNLPGTDNAEQEGIELENGGNFEAYVRCEDANGNSNLATFVFKYCVEKGPDYEVPEVIDTSVINNFPVGFGEETFDFQIYVSEPAECRWSYEDTDYEDMPEQMNCPAQTIEDAIEFNARTVYPCSTTITGIKDRQENKIYFRCKDQPLLAGTERDGDRNTNSQSYVHTFIGTQPLVIDEAGPNGTIRDSTEAVKVILTAETSAGFNEGEAICSYKEVGDADFIDDFQNTNSYTHSTELNLAEGDYEFLIRCVDLGGNSDTYQIEFTAESDSDAPLVVRAYKDQNFLKVVTDEDAECVYDVKSCSYLFKDGLPMTDNEKEHFIDWDVKKKFYIKCRDEYGNEPNPDDCSIIIKTLE